MVSSSDRSSVEGTTVNDEKVWQFMSYLRVIGPLVIIVMALLMLLALLRWVS